MAQGDNFKRNDLPTLQQIRYLEQLKKLGNARGSVARIAETCGVYHGSVSRYFRICMDKDYLTENLEFTKKGRNWLEGYETLIKGLENYLKNIGTADQDIENTIKQMIENIDYYTLSCILRNDQKVRLTAYLEKKEESRGNTIGEVLEYGTYEVCFMLYNMENRERGDFSMANRGFRKPGILRHNRRGSYLQLERCEMSAVSRISGEKMTGHLETLKYERKGTLEKAVIKDNRLKIPLDACRFRRKPGGEIKGIISVTVSCSVGRVHMPESSSLLIFWF